MKKILTILIYACFISCNIENPIMEKWWPEPQPQPQDKPVTFYTVTFKENGGVPAIANQKIAAGGKVGKVPAMSRENDGFGGWYTDAACTAGNEWDFAQDTLNDKVTDADGTLTLYAKWVTPSVPPVTPPPLPPPLPEPVSPPAPPQVYLAVFQPNGGRPIPDYQLIADGGKVVEPTALRRSDVSGSWYGFGGWYTDDVTFNKQWNFATDVVNSSTADINGVLMLYAKWADPPPTPASHWFVTFDTDGGTPEPRSQDLMGGSKIVEPYAMNRDGYFFAGWYADPGFTRQWDFATDTLDDVSGANYITLYAKWLTIFYTVTFNADGGVPAPRDQIVAYGTKVEFPSAMRKPHQGFFGWYTDSGEWDFDTPVYADMTLSAQWGDEKFTVIFNSKNDLPVPDPDSGQHGQPLPENQIIADGGKIIEPPDPSRAGFCFAGWSINVTDDGPNSKWWDFDSPLTDDIIDSANLTYDPFTETVTLYAFWVPEDPNMVWVKKGSFIMGDDHVTGAKPAHKVTISKGFYIGRYPVTQGEYTDVMNPVTGTANPSHFIGSGDRLTNPVDQVTWYDAVRYCYQLNDGATTPAGLQQTYTITGIGTNINGNVITTTDAAVTPNWAGSGYRLPTEAEWEYAARGGNGSPGNYIYAGSDNPDDVGWYNTNSGSMTHPVGTKLPNGLGIYDMSGNIMEWCWDIFGSYTSGDQIDPKGPDAGSDRVRRGGSWNNAYGNLRTTIRNSWPVASNTIKEYWTLGFRIVRGPVSGPSYTGNL